MLAAAAPDVACRLATFARQALQRKSQQIDEQGQLKTQLHRELKHELNRELSMKRIPHASTLRAYSATIGPV